MPRFQTDDTFGDSLPAKRAGTAALGLYYRCGLWASRYTTDGFVPAEVAADYGTAEWVRKLLDAGLWLAVDGGFQMPLFLDDNPSAEKVAKERQAKAERQARWLEKHRNASSTQRRVSRPSSRSSKDASLDASEDDAPPLPSPKGEGVGGAPLREGAPPPTRTPTRKLTSGRLICATHQLEVEPGGTCRGCAADAVADDFDDLDQRPPVHSDPRRQPNLVASAALDPHGDGKTEATASDAAAELVAARQDLAASGEAPRWRAQARRELAARGHVHPKPDLVTVTAAELYRRAADNTTEGTPA